MQAAGLKKNGDATDLSDDFHLAPVKRDDVTFATFDVDAGDERSVLAESFGRPAEHVELFRVGKVIHIAGVHVDGVHQSGTLRGQQVLLKSLNGYSAVRFVGQKGGGDALDFSARLDLLEHCVDVWGGLHISLTSFLERFAPKEGAARVPSGRVDVRLFRVC